MKLCMARAAADHGSAVVETKGDKVNRSVMFSGMPAWSAISVEASALRTSISSVPTVLFLSCGHRARFKVDSRNAIALSKIVESFSP